MFSKKISFMILVSLLTCSICNDEFVVTQRLSRYLCSTNTSFALSWITNNLKDSTEELISVFTPRSDFEWRISKEDNNDDLYSQNVWSLKRDLSQTIILDRRWEEMHIDEISGNKNLTVVNDLAKEFIIYFSLRAERGAHIFLCGSKSWNCFWLQLRAYKEKKTSLLQCNKNPSDIIKTTIRHYERGCTRNMNEKKYNPKEGPYLDANEWKHFQLQRNSTGLTLTQIDENGSRVVITCTSNCRTSFDITRMIIHGYDVGGFWKIHKLDYLFTKKKTKDTVLGPKLRVSNGFICVSLMVWMCKICEITISLKSTDEPTQRIFEKNFTQSENKWTEIVIAVDGLRKKEAILLVSTLSASSNDDKNNFWAVDNLRKCQREEQIILLESRSISSEYQAKCQLMKSNSIDYRKYFIPYVTVKNVTSKDEYKNNSEAEKTFENNMSQNTKCPIENSSFSKNCSDTESRTKCSAIREKDIKTQIFNTSLGIQLDQRKRKGMCNFRDVKIYLQKEEIKVNSSDSIYLNNLIPFTDYILTIVSESETMDLKFKSLEGVPGKVWNLTSISKFPTEIILKWNPPNYFYGNFTNYTIKYQKQNHLACYQEAVSFKNRNIVTKNTTISIENLSPYSNYSFSVFANNNRFQSLPENKWILTPASDALDRDEIPDHQNILPNTTFVEINFSSKNCTEVRGPIQLSLTVNCKSQWCKNIILIKFKCFNKISKMWSQLEHVLLYNPEISTCRVDDLAPFSRYSLKMTFSRNTRINFTFEFVFQTLADIPNSVQDLLVYSKNESSISLRWKSPYPPTGNLSSYHIQYKNVTYTGTLLEISLTSSCKLWPTYICVVLSNLKNNSKYDIEVRARNMNISDLGHKASTVATTKIEKSQPPYDLTINWTSKNRLELTWKHPNQTNGDIKYFMITFLVDEKFMGHELVQDNYQLQYKKTIEANKFHPSTQYEIRITAYNGYFSEELKKSTFSPPKSLSAKQSTTATTQSKITTTALATSKTTPAATTTTTIAAATSAETSTTSTTTITTTAITDLGSFSTSSSTVISFFTTQSYGNMNFTTSIIKTLDESQYAIFILLSGITILLLLIISALVWITYIRKKTNSSNCPVNGDEEMPLTSMKERNLQNDVSGSVENVAEKYIKLNNNKVEDFYSYVKDIFTNKKIIKIHETILNNAKSTQYEVVKENTTWDYIDLPYDKHLLSKAYRVTTIPSDFDEFWKIILEENIKNIIFLDDTSISKKNILEKIWPDENETVNFNDSDITVTCDSCRNFKEYKHGTFGISYQEEKRRIEQFYFFSWPYKDIPDSSLGIKAFLQKIAKVTIDAKSPVLILSGEDRQAAGLILLCDIYLRIDTDIEKVAQALANNNIKLLSNLKYYGFAHLMILEYLLSKTISTRISCKDFDPKLAILARQAEIKLHLKHMKKLHWLDQTVKNLKRGFCFDLDVGSKELDEERQYTYLDALNSITIGDLTDAGKFIVTQQPRKNTINYFWKLVEERNVLQIISLNFTAEQFRWWPNEKRSKFRYGQLKLEHKETKKFENYFCVTVDLYHHQKKMTIDMFLMKNWSPKMICPENVNDFVNFYIESSTRIHNHSNTVIVTCWDGRKASGLYLALFHIVEKINIEEICDICSSVRMLKSYHQEFIKYDEQFMFLWEATERFLKERQLYETVL